MTVLVGGFGTTVFRFKSLSCNISAIRNRGDLKLIVQVFLALTFLYLIFFWNPKVVAFWAWRMNTVLLLLFLLMVCFFSLLFSLQGIISIIQNINYCCISLLIIIITWLIFFFKQYKGCLKNCDVRKENRLYLLSNI